MNRETKRMMQRQGQVGPDGEPTTARRQPPKPVRGTPQQVGERFKPAQFYREVVAELRRVAWPNRAETLNSSAVVLIALVVLTTIIFAMDWTFSKSVLFLFKQ